MSNDQDSYQKSKGASTSDPDPEPGAEALGSDDVIELTEVVREGKAPLDFEADAPLLLDDEKPEPELTSFAEEGAPGELEATSSTPENTGETEDLSSEDAFSALESSDFKFENTSAFEDAGREPFPEQSQEHLDDVLAGLEKEVSAFEKPEDILADLERDDPEEPRTEQVEDFFSGYEETTLNENTSDMPARLDEEGKEDEETEIHPPSDISGISEEKMTELLTGIIQETVSETAEKVIRETMEQTIRQAISEIAEKTMGDTIDRAVRETVSETAEKVIREAIDTLKQSIASSEL